MNPYEVLGVENNASMDEIREAYRKLVKQYHPDKYKDNPLESLAQEKIKEINKAYDTICKERENGGGSYSGGGSGEFYEIRMHLQNNNLSAAQALLDKISNHNAEWHYLQGLIYLRNGWYDHARENLNMAYQMQPNNPEYSSAYNSMNNMAYNQRTRGYRAGAPASDDCCKICTALYCLNCCCNGGGC